MKINETKDHFIPSLSLESAAMKLKSAGEFDVARYYFTTNSLMVNRRRLCGGNYGAWLTNKGV